MTKHELNTRYKELLKEKGMWKIDGISVNSNKKEFKKALKAMDAIHRGFGL